MDFNPELVGTALALIGASIAHVLVWAAVTLAAFALLATTVLTIDHLLGGRLARRIIEHTTPRA